jgi:isopenicillin-N N-acyltransferase-like protein
MVGRLRFLKKLASRSSGNTQASKNSGKYGFHEFRGTPFQVGEQHGKALAREIRQEVAPFLNWSASQHGVKIDAAAKMLVARYEGLFRERMPGVIEEVRGIAEGAKLSYDHAFVAGLHDMMGEGCTAIACRASQSAAGPFVAQTKDSEGSANRFLVMRCQYSSGRSMVLLNYPGWLANTGITSDGLSFASFSLGAAPPQKINAPGSFLKRLILESKSTAAVVDGISGLTFPNGGYLIADRSGHAVCIEIAAGRTAVLDVSGGLFGHTNLILSQELKRFMAPHEDVSSGLRQERIEHILSEQQGCCTVEGLEEYLRDHSGHPLSICRHNAPSDEWTTKGAFVADLSAGEIHIAIGNPCTAPFKRYSLTA